MNANFENVYIDESGNTGADLLNKAQKFFVLASNNFNEEELNSLKKLFSTTHIHFKDLKNNEEGRKSIIKFLNHPLITEDNIICVAAHKEFATVGQIVDQIIEPIYYNSGIDIYQYGYNIIISNFIFHFGNFIWDKNNYIELLKSFITMMRKKTQVSINEFYNQTDLLYNSDDTNGKYLLEPILTSKQNIDDILEFADKFTIDITLSSFYVLCDLWYRKVKKKLNILHDDSKQINHYQENIKFTKNLNIPNQEAGFDKRKMIFPTQINKLELVSSKTNFGVQLSDLIASSLFFMYNNTNQKQIRFVNNIKNSKLLKLTNYFTIWPRKNFTPKDLKMESGEGKNLLDFLVGEMKRRQKDTNINNSMHENYSKFNHFSKMYLHNLTKKYH